MKLAIMLLCIGLQLANSRLAPLYSSSRGVQNRYIVKLQDDVDVDIFANNIKTMMATLKYDCYISLKYNRVLKGFLVDLNLSSLRMVRELHLVAFVESDSYIKTSDVASWGLDRIDQRYLPLDNTYDVSGIQLVLNILYILFKYTVIIQCLLMIFLLYLNILLYILIFFNCYNQGIDCNGHGTHCAGIAAGKEYGVAKGVNVHSVRVLDCNGVGWTSNVIQGMEWVAANASKPAVASMSLGGTLSMALNNAADSLVQSGVVLVAASGNEASDACTTSPASAVEVISVSSSNKNDEWSTFSNEGSCIDIIAPGEEIVSAWIDSDTSSQTLTGTSMACPHVAGCPVLKFSVS
ncbi:aqualysin-1-like [Anneissia japonica]|uniref:aqualysin-1-like n=1 Tax=Anneissia japonica TaxID=1529436 RepID=UPI00142563E3|nr:aqualysin-1-like [Anneissia japonica]